MAKTSTNVAPTVRSPAVRGRLDDAHDQLDSGSDESPDTTQAAAPPAVLYKIKQQRADARRNREKILAAAEQAFRELGAAVQMEEVAHRAGVGVGTLYRHFPTKEILVSELASERFSGCISEAESALGDADAWAAIECFVYRNAEQMATDAGLRDTFAAACQQGGISREKRDQIMERVGTLLDRAKIRRRVRADVTTDDIRALMCGLSAAIGTGGDWRRLASVMLAGIRASEQSPAS
jgi:AcrR family transcriptional regulator